MVRILVLCVSVFVLATGIARAEPYPGHEDLFANDLAGVLDPAALGRLRGALETLKTDTGVEMTVLTIPSRADYDDSASIEAFATRLFNGWGIGRKEFNDGILVLVAVEDREMRLELGSGYDQGYDVYAQDIVNRWFLPEFKNGNYAAGIEAGVAETITAIARRHAEGLPAPKAAFDFSSWIDTAFPWLFGILFAGVATTAVFGRHVADWTFRFRRCPGCGQRGLHREHQGPSAPSRRTGRILTTCAYCDYRDDRPWRLSQSSSDSGSGGGGGSFGGGGSSGGGASGRW